MVVTGPLVHKTAQNFRAANMKHNNFINLTLEGNKILSISVIEQALI